MTGKDETNTNNEANTVSKSELGGLLDSKKKPITNWTYSNLESKTITELEAIKAGKINDLYEIRKKRHLLISNILSLQEMERREIPLGV